MKTYIADIIPKLQQYSEKLDNLTLLTNQHWVAVDEIANSKTVYIFRSNNELLISKNGEVEKARWEYLGNNSLLLDLKDKSYLFRHGFFDENILALKVDSNVGYAFLVNETKCGKEINSVSGVLEFLNEKYLDPRKKSEIGSTIGVDGVVKKIENRPGDAAHSEPSIQQKSQKEELSEKINDLKSNLQVDKIIIWILSFILFATLIISLFVPLILIFSSIIGFIIALILSGLNVTLKSLKEIEKEMSELKDEVTWVL